MDERLKNALDFARYKETFEMQKVLAKEKLESKITFGYNGGIFKADRELIVFVQFLLDNDRKTDVPILDINETPILIKDLEDFNVNLLDRYFSGLLEYYNEHERLKKSRSVEKLLDL